MKKIISLVVVVALVAVAFFVGSKVIHRCDDCEEVFFGAGYEPNIIEDFVSEDDQMICKDCAEKQHAVSVALGMSLDEFKIDIF